MNAPLDLKVLVALLLVPVTLSKIALNALMVPITLNLDKRSAHHALLVTMALTTSLPAALLPIPALNAPKERTTLPSVALLVLLVLMVLRAPLCLNLVACASALLLATDVPKAIGLTVPVLPTALLVLPDMKVATRKLLPTERPRLLPVLSAPLVTLALLPVAIHAHPVRRVLGAVPEPRNALTAFLATKAPTTSLALGAVLLLAPHAVKAIGRLLVMRTALLVLPVSKESIIFSRLIAAPLLLA